MVSVMRKWQIIKNHFTDMAMVYLVSMGLTGTLCALLFYSTKGEVNVGVIETTLLGIVALIFILLCALPTFLCLADLFNDLKAPEVPPVIRFPQMKDEYIEFFEDNELCYHPIYGRVKISSYDIDCALVYFQDSNGLLYREFVITNNVFEALPHTKTALWKVINGKRTTW